VRGRKASPLHRSWNTFRRRLRRSRPVVWTEARAVSFLDRLLASTPFGPLARRVRWRLGRVLRGRRGGS
jgi:hypothetical protein